jgi:hypothetical protein
VEINRPYYLKIEKAEYDSNGNVVDTTEIFNETDFEQIDTCDWINGNGVPPRPSRNLFWMLEEYQNEKIDIEVYNDIPDLISKTTRIIRTINRFTPPPKTLGGE